MKRKSAPAVKVETVKMLLCTPGTFFVFTKNLVHIDVLSDTETTRLWEKLTLADACVFVDPFVAREQVLRQVFGQDAQSFLPANRAACVYLSEHYEGPMKDMVQGLAACILTGTPFGPDENPRIDGGVKIPVGPVPKDSGPTGATFDLCLGAEKSTILNIA